ncbi:MAG: O-antigen ligase family protein [Gaiellaceae bacterium]
MSRHLERAAVALVPLALVPALGAAGGGFQPDTWVWAGALAAWGAAVAVTVTDHPGALRVGWPWLLGAATFLLWTLASTLWSVEPAQSLLEARRMVVYAAVALALVVLARRGGGSTVVAGAHAGVSVLVLFALARYLLGGRHYVPFEGYLISRPLGYANAVGILSAMGLLLSLAPATGGSDRRRAAAAALVPPLALALELSSSRASWLALAVGFAVFVALHPAPPAIARPLLALVVPAAAAVWVGQFSRLVDVGQPPLGGPVVLLLVLGCAAAAAVTAARLKPRPRDRRPLARAILLSAALVVAMLGAAVALRAAAGQPRTSYYHTAWHEYRAHPVLGSGAGTFGHYWLTSGLEAKWGGALDAHSLYLETLAEVGPVGVVLLLAFLLYPLRRAVAGREQPWVAAATGATAAFLVHAGLDWDWELPAVVVAALACAAGIAFANEAPTEPVPRLARAATLAAALLLGAAAIAGARSATEPSAAPETTEAPQSGAPVAAVSARARYL